MEKEWIGLIGVIAGVTLTSIVQLLEKIIDHKKQKANRWIDDKRQVYSEFLFNADIYFKYSMSLNFEEGADQARSAEIVNNARMKLNETIAKIGIFSNEETLTEAESLEEWLHNNNVRLDDSDKATINSDSIVLEFKNRKKRFTTQVRKDFDIK